MSKDKIEIETLEDTALIHLLETRLANELFKQDNKNYQIARYLLDLIEVLVESLEEDGDADG